MYKVLDKDTIKNEILPHLSIAKRGYICQSSLSEVIQCILYKLKTGCQWYMLPVSSFFTAKVLHCKTVYGHFRKWCKKGEWQTVWTTLLNRYKSFLDMSSIDLDGSHTTALRGGDCQSYQGRKKRKTTNAIYVTDRQGIPLAMSTPVAGSHNDLYNISEVVKEVFSQLTKSDISTDGLFLNADAGFDAKEFRHTCLRMGVFANVAFNHRVGGGEDCYLFDDILYKERYSIERTNAWLDSYRSLLNRFDVTLTSWQAWNYIAFIIILMKKVKKKQKSR